MKSIWRNKGHGLPLCPSIHLNYLDGTWRSAQDCMQSSPASLLTLDQTELDFFFFPEWNVSKVTFIGVCWLVLTSGKQCKAEVLGLDEAGPESWRLLFKPKFPTEQLGVTNVYNAQKHFYKQNNMAASQRNGPLPTVNSLHFWGNLSWKIPVSSLHFIWKVLFFFF